MPVRNEGALGAFVGIFIVFDASEADFMPADGVHEVKAGLLASMAVSALLHANRAVYSVKMDILIVK